MNKMIIGDRITKSFGERQEQQNVLDEVSVEIDEGEFVAIMGPSGSGKSTLMFALSGMDRVNSGTVVFKNKNLAEMDEKELSEIRRTKMGFVFQQPTMLKNLTIFDNIILPVMRDQRKNTENITEKARALMKRVGIEAISNYDITQVSGGQLQRAGICRALMNDPQIIFGDEPTGALNSQTAQEILSIFSEINEEGTTIVLVTHDVKVAAQTERILYMRDGKIVQELKLPKYNGTNLESRMEQVTKEMMHLGI
ncbi:ABC transporter ATP-binding protein [Solibacillus sp. FSL R7-0668]|uniref:ABC transporter ATP-binding protein n=1 Tax=Solibacillus sp. FSL R7-0668 TaxID=2921688 RepID=UPI0030F60FCF